MTGADIAFADLKGAADTFEDRWKLDTAKTTLKRSFDVDLSETTLKSIGECIDKSILKKVSVDNVAIGTRFTETSKVLPTTDAAAHSTFARLLRPSLYSIPPLWETTAWEGECCGSLRIQFKGTRSVAVARLGERLQFLQAKDQVPNKEQGGDASGAGAAPAGVATLSLSQVCSENLTLAQVRESFRNMSAETHKTFIGMGYSPVQVFTIEPGNALWLPMGYIFAEQTGNQNVLGLKIGTAAIDSLQDMETVLTAKFLMERSCNLKLDTLKALVKVPCISFMCCAFDVAKVCVCVC